MLDHDEDVEATQEHGIDLGEVDGEDRVGLRGQELSSGNRGRPSQGSCQRSRHRQVDHRWSGVVAAFWNPTGSSRSTHPVVTR